MAQGGSVTIIDISSKYDGAEDSGAEDLSKDGNHVSRLQHSRYWEEKMDRQAIQKVGTVPTFWS